MFLCGEVLEEQLVFLSIEQAMFLSVVLPLAQIMGHLAEHR